MDINSFAIELAKVTMMIGRKLAIDELHIADEADLPLDNLDANFSSVDALMTDHRERPGSHPNPLAARGCNHWQSAVSRCEATRSPSARVGITSRRLASFTRKSREWPTTASIGLARRTIICPIAPRPDPLVGRAGPRRHAKHPQQPIPGWRPATTSSRPGRSSMPVDSQPWSWRRQRARLDR